MCTPVNKQRDIYQEGKNQRESDTKHACEEWWREIKNERKKRSLAKIRKKGRVRKGRKTEEKREKTMQRKKGGKKLGKQDSEWQSEEDYYGTDVV